MSSLEHKKSRLIFDPLYGFIQITPVEWAIIHSPFYQRLRWIKQLGFSSYVFPGAEHSRFGHSIGVMYNAHLITKSCGRAVSDQELMDRDLHSKSKDYHQAIRLGALMHDLGTFCFSHTTEAAYIRFGETTKSKHLSDDHENLGSFIIKNTNYEGGITAILEEYGYDPQIISDLVKGISPSVMANQILHSEIDCDRMDYLLRDAHYTGLQYGSYDRDYLLYHFTPRRVGNHDILTIKYNALHCVEDFLCSRFAWYSQVIRTPRGAKYDAIAENICLHFLERDSILKYSDLLDLISKDPIRFFSFNDSYFINKVQTSLVDGSLNKFPKIKDMAETLLIGKEAHTARCPELRRELLDPDDKQNALKLKKRVDKKVDEIQSTLEKYGDESAWLIRDVPKKDISFVKSKKNIILGKENENVLLERDPVKITFENGDIKLLVDIEESIIHKLQNSQNFMPNVFISRSAQDILLKEGIIEPVKIPV